MKKSLRSIGNISSKITAPLLGKQGHVLGAILADWGKIVGEKILSLAVPQKIVFRNDKRVDGTLHLLISSGAGPLIQQISPMVIERINTYFGYGAVSMLRIHQGFIPAQKKEETDIVELSSQDLQFIGETTEHIQEEALREALENFGKSLIQSQKQKNKS
ncbi:DUF721 domain-containing protein [Candidatus Bealeia paramacronuclearis]|uniref:DUF721 domain-containing protein n=1 Tax=Candidatus Bealeia paramacronuclearis TaxID=1921001 RepID=A0ABZ2C6D0_9PROT|nr:hypothetical protein [Candidatus Bealeia paramacronuclearis]